MNTVHHVDDYGGDPTGREPSDSAFDAAVATAEDGDWIALTNGTYYLAEGHDVRKELVVCGTGGVIESDFHPGHGYDDDYPRQSAADGTQLESLAPIVAFRGNRGERVALSKRVPEGHDQVPVADASRFEVGSGVLLSNEDLDVETVVGAVGNRTRTYEPTVSTVRAIDGDTIFLDVPARYDYPANDDHHAYPLSFLDRTGFVDCHFRNRHEPYWDETRGKVMGGFRHAMCHEYCRAPIVRDCSVRGYDTKMWVPIDVLEAQVINPRAEAPLNVNGSHGEPLYILGSTNVNIYNPVIRGARRAIDVRAGCKDVNVYNPDITGVTFLGLSYHHGYDEYVRGNLNVYGGRVYCKPTDPTQDDHGGEAERRWELQQGNGMRGTPANGRVHVSGTSFVVRRHGATCYGSGTVIRDCEFRTVPRGCGTSKPVLSISGEDITIRNTLIDAGPNGTDHESAIRIDDATDVELDVRVRGEFRSAPVAVHGGDRLRLWLRASDTGEECGVYIGGIVSDLEVSGDLYNDGPGIEFAEDLEATHVRVREFTHRGDGPTLRVPASASLTDLRLSGVTSIHNGRLELGESVVDGLRIRDVSCASVCGLHPDQERDERTVLEGIRLERSE